MKNKKIVFLLSLPVVGYLLFNVASAFTGPTVGQQPGSGGGLLFTSSTFVGIGTTNPAGILHVYSTGNNSSIFFGEDTSLTTNAQRGFRISPWSDGNIYVDTKTYNGGRLQFRIGEGTSAGGTNSWMAVDASNGYVGIATTTPAYPLSVDGNIWTSGSFIGALSGGLSAANVSGPSAFGSNYGTYSYAFPGALAVGTTTVTGLPTNGLFVNGSVGIGTSTPDHTLTLVSPTAADWAMKIQNTTANGVSGFGAYDNSGTFKGYYGYDNGEANFVKIYAGTGVGIKFIPNANTAASMTILSSGNVGIATTTPGSPLTVAGVVYSSTGGFKFPDGTTQTTAGGGGTGVWGISGSSYIYPTSTSYNVTIGTTTDPGTNKLYVNGAAYINGNLAMGANNISLTGNISNVNKLTVTTIDPVYEIGGVKYATYGASIAGGVKEEYVGRGKLAGKNAEYAIDFGNLEKGSDLWVWYNAVDFGVDNIDVLATAYGSPASIWYEISGQKIIFHGTAPAEFSYRLIGKRHDWKNWPTFVKDQTEKPSFIIR